MTNFSINFTRPWMLLFLIGAGLLTFIPYFLSNKKYRRTRNKIVSIVLHTIIMVLSVSVLAGATIEYDTPSEKNEVILLVDASHSGKDSEAKKDNFIRSVIDNSNSMYKLGIVTFGYDQVYAVPLTDDADGVYSRYLESETPNTSATDIESALVYTAKLFNSPESARIVLITDAIETDGEAEGVIKKTIAAKGIKVDTVFFPETLDGDSEVEIVTVETPNKKINVGEEFNISLLVKSSVSTVAEIIPYDDGVAGTPVSFNVSEGEQKISIPYCFNLPGLHKLSFEMKVSDDTLVQNNSYHSYIYLEVFDKILIIESIDSESEQLTRMLRSELNVDILSSYDHENLPRTVDELRQYDEVILCNVANSDLPEEFFLLLRSYVYDFGGGLFTVCGNKEDANPNDDNFTANAFTREDMFGTVYQEMLPVEVINYTPPVGVMIIIDSSGSMFDPDSEYEESKLYFAKQGAEACLQALTERDYVGIMSLSDTYNEVLELTPRPQRDKILAAIEKVGGGGGTVFSTAIERAGKALAALSAVEKRHIIIVTDGEPSSEDESRYEYFLEENAKLGITTSIVGIDCTSSAKYKMEQALVEHAGMSEKNFHAVDGTNISSVPTVMRDDLMSPEIKEVNYEEYTPKINVHNFITKGINEADMPHLDGFYGVKLKDGADAILTGPFTPLYAQWTFGKGTVGSFTCDLNGTWSSEFVGTDTAITLINNIVTALFPKENIRPKEIDLTVSGDNYTTSLNVFTTLHDGESVRIEVVSPIAEGETEPRIQVLSATSEDKYTSFTFSVLCPGIHEITATKYNAEGVAVAVAKTYKALGYSKEYDVFNDPETAEALIASLAEKSGGVIVKNPGEVFDNSVKYVHEVIDPRIVFIITALVLFLLDIAVRKFKWKWPHEIIRDRKIKKTASINKV